jgi:hypothetical protein
MQRSLSFDDSPPLSVPLRFFLTSPLFGVAAALVLLWHGAAALSSRWALPTLALTHLITLGFLAMSMCGALLQILPVVAGVNVLAPKKTSSIVYHALLLGSILLVAGFLFPLPFLYRAAGPTLGLAFLWLLVAVYPGLRTCSPGNAAATIHTIRLALLSLLVTVCLGLALVSSFGWQLPLPVMRITDVHAAWGLVGWVGLLLFGVGFQVIPMFQATPVYPYSATSPLAGLVAVLLGAWSLAALSEDSSMAALRGLVAIIILGALVGFGLVTLRLLQKRRRPEAEATTLFWRLSMASLLACGPAYLVPMESKPLLLGVLLMLGCAFSAVNGMLYKIVPFLLWYHLQSRSGLDRKAVPSLRELLPDRAAKQQFWLHVASLVLLLFAVALPNELARPAAAMFGMSCLRLWWNMVFACLVFRRVVGMSSTGVGGAVGKGDGYPNVAV